MQMTIENFPNIPSKHIRRSVSFLFPLILKSIPCVIALKTLAQILHPMN
jgi:hypothetical protein